jgi:hypothetical protein
MEKERLNPRNIGLNTRLSGPDSSDFAAVQQYLRKKRIGDQQGRILRKHFVCFYDAVADFVYCLRVYPVSCFGSP